MSRTVNRCGSVCSATKARVVGVAGNSSWTRASRASPVQNDSHALKRRDFDSKAHHFHEPGTPGSMCVDCHAPQRTYMQVDPRRDHSFRIPRPDLTLAIGTPNACDACHADKGARWSADAIERWYGPDRRQERHYGVAIDAARAGKPGAADGLLALVADEGQPAIVRATALSLLARDPSPHRTRRIRRRGPAQSEISCGAWRAVFAVEGTTVTVIALEPAYPMKFLTRPGYDDVPDREAQLAFLARWPAGG